MRSWKLLASRDENFCALAMLAVLDVQWARHWRKKGAEPLAQCFYSRAPYHFKFRLIIKRVCQAAI